MIEVDPARDTFEGVPLTPNVVSRAYDLARAAAFVVVEWWFARCGGERPAEPRADEHADLYFK